MAQQARQYAACSPGLHGQRYVLDTDMSRDIEHSEDKSTGQKTGQQTCAELREETMLAQAQRNKRTP